MTASTLRGVRQLACWVCVHVTAAATLPAHAGGTSQGAISARLSGGGASAYGNQYAVLGIGAGYYVVGGLQLGLDAEAWVGGAPNIYRLSPEARYVLALEGNWLPYIGAYYRHTVVEGRDNLASIGGRTGVLFDSGGTARFGAGVVYAVMLNCDSRFASSCSQVYPEMSVSVSF